MTAATAVAALLDRSGWSKKRLCEAAGISRSSLDLYLRGERQPSVAQLERLGAAVGVRLDPSWVDENLDEDTASPSWLKPDAADMRAPVTTVAQRAELLARVVPLSAALPRRAAGELEFPPFKQMRSA